MNLNIVAFKWNVIYRLSLLGEELICAFRATQTLGIYGLRLEMAALSERYCAQPVGGGVSGKVRLEDDRSVSNLTV